jgi:hypothetical protein
MTDKYQGRGSARDIKASLWVAAGTFLGGGGSMIVGPEDHPLRHIFPKAVNYFEHSGNMYASGVLAASGVVAAHRFERSRGWLLSARKFAGVALLGGLLFGGAASAAYETETGYELVGQHMHEGPRTTPEPWDIVWGAGFTALIAAGMGGDLRRYDLKHASPPPQLPSPEQE